MSAPAAMIAAAIASVYTVRLLGAIAVARRSREHTVLSAFLVGWQRAPFPLMSPTAWSWVLGLGLGFAAVALVLAGF